MNINTENQPVYDCIIIGAGVSGISFAHYLRTVNKSVLILEEKDRIGGQIQTFSSNTDNSYWYELGSHTCYNTYVKLLKIVEDTEYTTNIQSLDKCKYVLYTSSGIRKVFSELSLIPMAANCGKIFFSSTKGKTVREYFRPIIGKSNYDKVFSNLFKAVISQKADEYPAEIFLKRRKIRNKNIVRKYSFSGGLASFLQNVVNKDNIPVKINHRVDDIQYDNETNLFTVITNTGEIIKTHNIALATNPQTTAKLTQEIDKPISDILNPVSLFRTESLNVIVSQENLNISKIAGIIPLNNDFLSVVTRDVVEHPQLRSFTFHFEKGKKNKEEKINIICNVLNIDSDMILEQTQTEHVLPALRLNDLGMASKLDNVRNNQNIFILGNYFHGVSIEDCIHRSSDEFERFKKKSCKLETND